MPAKLKSWKSGGSRLAQPADYRAFLLRQARLAI